MKTILFLTFFLASCASNNVIVNTENLPYKELGDDAYVRSGSPNLYIDQVIDSREYRSSLGVAKTGALGDEASIVTKTPLVEVVKHYLNERLLHRGFLVSESSKNYLKIEIVAMKLWESPPRTVPERSYCDVIIKASLNNSSDTQWSGEFTSNITSPEHFDSTKYLSTTFATCLDHAISKMAKEKKFQALLNYEYN